MHVHALMHAGFNVYVCACRSIPLFLSIPFLVRQVVESGSSLGLYGFIGSTVCAVTIMGGTYAILPAYEVRGLCDAVARSGQEWDVLGFAL
jgi:hypothetical protein